MPSDRAIRNAVAQSVTGVPALRARAKELEGDLKMLNEEMVDMRNQLSDQSVDIRELETKVRDLTLSLRSARRDATAQRKRAEKAERALARRRA